VEIQGDLASRRGAEAKGNSSLVILGIRAEFPGHRETADGAPIPAASRKIICRGLHPARVTPPGVRVQRLLLVLDRQRTPTFDVSTCFPSTGARAGVFFSFNRRGEER
jgi:hypothetical protein